MKLIKLCFDAQFCGYEEKIVEVPDNADDNYIKSLFNNWIGAFDDNCWYEEAQKGN